MNSIQPLDRIPFTAAAGVSAPVQASAQWVDFASLLSRDGLAEVADRGSPSTLPRESRQSDLEAGLAHVFNAFGFFQASPKTDASMQRDPAVAPEPGYGTSNSGERELETTQPANTSISPPVGRGSSPAQTAVSLDSPLPLVKEVSDQEFRFAVASVQPSLAAVAPPSPWPTPLFARLVEGSSSTAAAASNPSSRDMLSKHPDATPANLRSAYSEKADRLTFRWGEQIIEFIGRFEGLSEDDEKKLIEALAELLANHGLSLGAATLNGRPVDLGMPGGEN